MQLGIGKNRKSVICCFSYHIRLDCTYRYVSQHNYFQLNSIFILGLGQWFTDTIHNTDTYNNNLKNNSIITTQTMSYLNYIAAAAEVDKHFSSISYNSASKLVIFDSSLSLFSSITKTELWELNYYTIDRCINQFNFVNFQLRLSEWWRGEASTIPIFMNVSLNGRRSNSTTYINWWWIQRCYSRINGSPYHGFYNLLIHS